MSKTSARSKRVEKKAKHSPDHEIDFSDIPELSDAQLGVMKHVGKLHLGKEPIPIRTRSGRSFVLMDESQYAHLKNEIRSLQRRLLGMSDVLSGKVTEYKPGDKSRLGRISQGRKR